MEKRALARQVGRRIRALRKELHLTQERLAFETDLGKGHVSKLERGLQDPGLDTLARIAVRLGVEPWELLIDPQRSLREQLVAATRDVPAATLRNLWSTISEHRDGHSAQRGLART